LKKDLKRKVICLFSIGNGAMGQRANFEESYSGDTFRKLYCRNILSGQTKVGWWKNGYPIFAKVLNAPN
jgi:maltose phosphorylase